MADKFVLGAQLSTAHSAPGALEPERVLAAIGEANAIAPLDILIVGAGATPELYRALTAPGSRPAPQVYLWYDLLSDYPGLEPSDLVVNCQGDSCAGWGGWAEHEGDVSETFRFACPNKPGVRAKTLRALERLLEAYDFTGLFLDKLRYPSPANGLADMLTCFCPECRRAASARGLNLETVEQALLEPGASAGGLPGAVIPPGAPWLNALLAAQPALAHFIRFRADTISELVAAVGSVAAGLGKALALDLFTPGLAPLVGQDYPALASLAAWAKPMTYRLARGPAGLRLEVPALARGLGQWLGRDPDELLLWAGQYAPGLAGADLERIEREGVPLALVVQELRTAVALLAPVPVYLGLEAVSIPGVIDVTPKRIREMLEVGRAAGVAGAILSWDLLAMPSRNLRAVVQPRTGRRRSKD